MLLVDNVKKDKRIKMTQEEESLFGIDKLNIKRSSIPAITHVDYSARIQTVHKQTNPKYHALISKFKEKTGCEIVVGKNGWIWISGEPEKELFAEQVINKIVAESHKSGLTDEIKKMLESK